MLRLRQATLDSRVLLFALVLSLATVLVFGLASPLDSLRVETLSGERVTAHRRTWLRQALITSQLGVSLILLAGAGLLRAAIRSVDPTVPVKIETMAGQVDHYLTKPRFQTALLAMFAFTGVVLAGIGLYGLIPFLMEERTREIGVRIAVGATPGDIAKMVVSDGMRWTVAGVIVGIAGAASLLQVLEGLGADSNRGIRGCRNSRDHGDSASRPGTVPIYYP